MLNRVFLDTNVVLDLLGDRQPYYDSIAKIATLAEESKLILFASPLTFATNHYILTKYTNSKIAVEKLRKFKIICKISIMNEQVVEKSLNSEFTDFEDALQYFSALTTNCELILTRNGKDFKKSVLPVMTPNEYLNSLRK